MNAEPQEDWLDARLREEMPYIDDAGFTARVVQQLPQPRARRSLRALILVGVAIVSGVLAYLLGGRFVIEGVMRLSLFSAQTVILASVVCGILVTVLAALAAAFKARDLS